MVIADRHDGRAGKYEIQGEGLALMSGMRIDGKGAEFM